MLAIGIVFILLWVLMFLNEAGILDNIYDRINRRKKPKEEGEAHTCETCHFYGRALDNLPCYRCKRADEFRGDLWTEKEVK